MEYASISGGEIHLGDSPLPVTISRSPRPATPTPTPTLDTDSNISASITLTPSQKSLLSISNATNPATQKAMHILLHYASLQSAAHLIPVTRAHIDACIYTGPASLRIAEKFLELGARVAVPTTLNSISIDQRRWKEIGTEESLARDAGRLAEAYVAMGARGSFTCAPYLLAGDSDSDSWSPSMDNDNDNDNAVGGGWGLRNRARVSAGRNRTP
ncbi:hypothetical protein BJX70DRAFT_51850 [Aspergillus crustosus]